MRVDTQTIFRFFSPDRNLFAFAQKSHRSSDVKNFGSTSTANASHKKQTSPRTPEALKYFVLASSSLFFVPTPQPANPRTTFPAATSQQINGRHLFLTHNSFAHFSRINFGDGFSVLAFRRDRSKPNAHSVCGHGQMC